MKSLIYGISIGFFLTSFVGLAQSENWYEQTMNKLIEKKILQGYPDGSLRPDQPVNRAELAVIFDRTIKYLNGEEIEVIENIPEQVVLDVPFSSQAPYGNWQLPFKEACEETSIIMVNHFWNKQPLNADIATEEIHKLVAYEESVGMGVDIGMEEIANVAKANYNLNSQLYFDEQVTIEKIKELLAEGYPVIIPVAGQEIGNPNFKGAGPPYHVIVLIGYDSNNFIAHDPGTRFGGSFRYPIQTIDQNIYDWNGSKANVHTGRRAMIVLTP